MYVLPDFFPSSHLNLLPLYIGKKSKETTVFVCTCVCTNTNMCGRICLLRKKNHTYPHLWVYYMAAYAAKLRSLLLTLDAYLTLNAHLRRCPPPKGLPEFVQPALPGLIYLLWKFLLGERAWGLAEWWKRVELILQFATCVCEVLKCHNSSVNITDMGQIIILFIIAQAMKWIPSNSIGAMKGNIKLIERAWVLVSVALDCVLVQSFSSP